MGNIKVYKMNKRQSSGENFPQSKSLKELKVGKGLSDNTDTMV